MVRKIFCKYNDCVMIRDKLIELMKKTGIISIADYYDTAEVSLRTGMHEYALGWDREEEMKQIRIRKEDSIGLYFLKMPYPKVLG